jgi:hypothetical protein
LFVQVRSSEGKDLGIRVRFSVRPLSVRDPSKGADRGGWPCCNRGNNERAESLGDRVIGFGEEVTIAIKREAGGRVSGSPRHLKGAGSSRG